MNNPYEFNGTQEHILLDGVGESFNGSKVSVNVAYGDTVYRMGKENLRTGEVTYEGWSKGYDDKYAMTNELNNESDGFVYWVESSNKHGIPSTRPVRGEKRYRYVRVSRDNHNVSYGDWYPAKSKVEGDINFNRFITDNEYTYTIEEEQW